MSPAKAIRHLQWFFSFLFVLGSISLAFASNRDVIKASRNDVSPPLSQMVVGASSNGGGSNRQTPTARATGAMITNPNSEPVTAPFAGPLTGVTSFLDFDGQSAQDNRNLFGLATIADGSAGSTITFRSGAVGKAEMSWRVKL